MTIDVRKPGSKNQRRWRNFLLQPVIQMRVAAWAALVGALFSLAIALLFSWALGGLAEAYTRAGAPEEEVATTYQILEFTRLGALALLLSQVGASVITAIVTTHRLVGPTVAFRQAIRSMISGQYGRKLMLRPGDAFTEVADDLNTLSETLSQRHPGHKGSDSGVGKLEAVNS